MSTPLNFKNPFAEHLKTLEKFRSPMSALQRTLSEIGEPQRKLQLQLQQGLRKHQGFQNNQLLDAQDRLSKFQQEINSRFGSYHSALREFQEGNAKLLQSIGSINKLFELPDSYKNVLKEFSSSVGAFRELQNKQKALLFTLKIQEDFANKFESIAKFSSSEDLSEENFEIVDTLLTEVENGVRFHVEANPDVTTQMPVDQLLNYIVLFLNIFFFFYSTITDKSGEIIQATSELETTVESRFEHINARLDSI